VYIVQTLPCNTQVLCNCPCQPGCDDGNMIDMWRTLPIYMPKFGDDRGYIVINIISTAGRETEGQGGVSLYYIIFDLLWV
jgi:hypothetical protein